MVSADNSLRRTRRPKLPSNVQAKWRSTVGWRFRAHHYTEGTRHYGPWRANTQDAAQDALDLRQRGKQARSAVQLLTLEEGMKLVLRRAEDLRRSPGTLRHLAECFVTLVKHFSKDTPLHEIDLESIEAFRQQRLTTPVFRCRCSERATACNHTGKCPTEARVNKDVKALGQIFRTAKKAKRFAGTIPLDDDAFEWLPEADNENDITYTPEDVSEILASVREHGDCPTANLFHDIIVILFCSGLRIGELAHVAKQDLDFRRGTFSWDNRRELGTRRGGKTGSRTVYMNAPLRTALRRLTDKLSKSDYLLPGRTHDKRAGNLKSNLFKRWKGKIPEHLRPEFHAHTFRSAFQTHLESCGIPDSQVRRLMGRLTRKGDSHQRYSKPSMSHLKNSVLAAFDPLAELLLGSD